MVSMKQWIGILCWLMASLAFGQNKELRYFLPQKTVDCDSVYTLYRDSVLELSPQKERSQIKALHQAWRSYCEASEETLRLQILLNHALGRPLPTATEFRDYFPYYLLSLRNYQAPRFDTAAYRYLLFTSAWADSLHAKHPHLQLAVLSARSRRQLLDRLYGKEYWNQPAAEKLRALLEDDAWQTFGGIGLGLFQMVGPAQKFIGPSAHLNLFMGYGKWRPWRFDLGMQLQFYNFTRDSRFLRQDSVFTKQPPFGFHVYFKAAPRLWNSRLQEIRGTVSAGLETMSIISDDPETNINESLTIPAFNLGIGLEYNVRIRHQHQIGLSAQMHLVNFSQGQTSLDNLNGPYLNFGLHFR